MTITTADLLMSPFFGTGIGGKTTLPVAVMADRVQRFGGMRTYTTPKASLCGARLVLCCKNLFTPLELAASLNLVAGTMCTRYRTVVTL